MDSLPTQQPNAPTKCAIEACDTPTTLRRCHEHQAQLETNLAALAGGAA